MLNTLAWQHVKRKIGVRWSGELRIDISHLQRSSLSADLRPQRSASTSERGWLPQPRSHAVARTPYSSPHFGPSRRSDLSQNGLGQRNNKLYEKASLCPCFRPRLGSVRGNLPLVWNNLVLHPTRQREGFAGRTSPGAAFAAAGTLVLHGPRSSAIAVVKFFCSRFSCSCM